MEPTVYLLYRLSKSWDLKSHGTRSNHFNSVSYCRITRIRRTSGRLPKLVCTISIAHNAIPVSLLVDSQLVFKAVVVGGGGGQSVQLPATFTTKEAKSYVWFCQEEMDKLFGTIRTG